MASLRIYVPPGEEYSPDRDDYTVAEDLRASLGWGSIFLADHYDTVGDEVRRGAFETEEERIAEGIRRQGTDGPGYEHFVYRPVT